MNTLSSSSSSHIIAVIIQFILILLFLNHHVDGRTTVSSIPNLRHYSFLSHLPPPALICPSSADRITLSESAWKYIRQRQHHHRRHGLLLTEDDHTVCIRNPDEYQILHLALEEYLQQSRSTLKEVGIDDTQQIEILT